MELDFDFNNIGVRGFILTGAQVIVCRGRAGPLAYHPKHYRLVLRIKLRFLDGLGRRNSLSFFERA